MNRWMLSTFAVLGLATAAQAQPKVGSAGVPPTTSRPTVSPYLNLNRGGAGAAIDYFGIVRPQLETQKAISALQQQQGMQPGLPAGMMDDGLTTGQILTPGIGGFFNYSHYFPMYNRGAGYVGAGTTGSTFALPGRR